MPDLLTDLKVHPDFQTPSHDAWAAKIVSIVRSTVVEECRLLEFPDGAQGFSVSGVLPTVDLNGTPPSTNQIYVRVDKESPGSVSLTLANCTDGDTCAAELQAQINALGGLNEDVTVEWNAAAYPNQLLIKSGQYGPDSQVRFTWFTENRHLARALKLSPHYGGTEEPGTLYDPELYNVALELAVAMYQKIGLEGVMSGSTPAGIQFNAPDFPAHIMAKLGNHRKVFKRAF